jgi:hypothetical protein
MNDKEFLELHLKMTIGARQGRWPQEPVHWRKLHAVVDEARARVGRAYAAMDEIDRNANLSREDKNNRRQAIASRAIADFDGSRTLARAREAVRLLVDRDNPEMVEAALKEAEHDWQKAIDMIVERAARVRARLC